MSVPFASTLLVYIYSISLSDNILRKINFLLPWSADWQTDATPGGGDSDMKSSGVLVEKFELDNQLRGGFIIISSSEP